MQKLLLVGLLLLSFHCVAGSVTVTTTDDVVDAGACAGLMAADLPGVDGQTSLREAVCVANATAGGDSITLPAGVFALTLGGAGENANEAGDLDISETLTISGAGLGMTFIENGIGDAGILGDGDRVIEIGSGFVNDIDLTLEDLTVRNGDLSCTGIGCFSGAAGIHSESNGTLTLTRVAVTDHQTSCTGECCGSRENAAAIGLYNVGNLTVTDGFLNNNRASCSNTSDPLPACVDQGNGTFVFTASCEAGVSLMQFADTLNTDAAIEVNLSNTQIDGNVGECTGDACSVDEMMTFDSAGNSQSVTQSAVSMTDVQITNNTLQCTGLNCETDELVELDRDGEGDTTLIRMVLDNNTLQCTGESCDVDELLPNNGDPGIFILQDSQVTNNVLTCNGDPDGDGMNNIIVDQVGPVFNARACDTDEIVELDGQAQITVVRTIIADNQQTCTGMGCDTDELFSFTNIDALANINEVQLLRNLHMCDGTECDTDEIVDFDVQSGAVGVFSDSLVADNTVTCSGNNCRCDVAGIHIDSFGNGIHLIRNSTFSGNVSAGDDTLIPNINFDCAARSTGGIRLSNASLTVINTTITNNTSVSSGAGIMNLGDLTLSHVTISNNISDSDNDGIGIGAGICNNQIINIVDDEGTGTCSLSDTNVEFDPDNETGTVTIDNSIVAFNTANGVVSNCNGEIGSDGFNIIPDLTDCMLTGDVTVVDPLLAAVGDNGCNDPFNDGSCIPTQALLTGSPAIDAGSCNASGDQRGFFRPFDDPAIGNIDDGCDIGAFEVNSDHLFIDNFEL